MSDFSVPYDVSKSSQTGIGDLFRSTVSAQPDHLAAVDGARSLTYGELDHRTNKLANALLALGLQKGDRIAVHLHNVMEYVEIELAAAKTGIIVAALNWRLAAPELVHCIELVGPKLMFAHSSELPMLQGLSTKLPRCISLGDEYEGLIKPQSAAPSDVCCIPEDGLVILYTSGTTGMPKGALISHGAMIARAACFASELQLARDSNFIAWAPFFHMASTDHAIATLIRGGTVYIVDGYQPEQLMDLIEQVSVGWFVLMPGMVGEFAEACHRRKLKPQKIVACGAMADLVPKEQIVAATTALNAPYLNSFGATETGLPPATGGLIPVGIYPETLSKRQSAFCSLRLVGPDDNDVPEGEPGEIALRGPTLFSGYWGAEETNVHDFRNGWFHMGDVMRRNRDGSLDYVDRVKYLIKSGGENIYPAEIELVLQKDERVAEAVVVRKPHAKWGEVPVAFIVSTDAGVTTSQLDALCLSNLARYKRPRDYIFITDEDLPRSATGKIQRHLLEERLK